MSNPSKPLEIKQGESIGTWSFTLTGYTDISSADWGGRVIVKKAIQHKDTKMWMPSGASIVNKLIAKDALNTKFLTDVVPNESNLLDPFKYYFIITVIQNDNLGSPYKKELHNLVYILPKGSD